MINAGNADLEVVARIFRDMRDGKMVDESPSPGGLGDICRGMNHALYLALRREVFATSVDDLSRPARANQFLFRMMAELTEGASDRLFSIAIKGNP